MGANATTFVPAYVAGEVLTAADLSVTNSGIPVFDTTTTRDAAFGGTGEKALAEGQFAYIEATNATQYYDGAAWQSVGTNPGLVCVKATTAISAVNFVNVDNVFTTTYDSYLVIFEGLASATDSLYSRYRVGGTTNTTTNYAWQYFYANSTTLVGGTLSAQQGNNHGDIGTTKSSFQILFTKPAQAEAKNFQGTSIRNANFLMQTGGQFSAATAFDGIQLFTVNGSTITATYSIYAYSKTV